MPRFVNLPTTDGNEESVRVDRIESVRHGEKRVGNGYVDEVEIAPDESTSWVVTDSGCQIPVALPKPRVMELLGLHLTGNGEEWV